MAFVLDVGTQTAGRLEHGDLFDVGGKWHVVQAINRTHGTITLETMGRAGWTVDGSRPRRDRLRLTLASVRYRLSRRYDPWPSDRKAVR